MDYVNEVIKGNRPETNNNSESNYFVSLLEDHQYEKLIIALCVKLEGIFQNRFDLNGSFQEMMQDFTINYADEHMTELLNKLRMKRNNIVHAERKEVEMSIEEIQECINLLDVLSK